VADRRHPLRRIGRPKPSATVVVPPWLVRRSKRRCGSGRVERYALLGTWFKCQRLGPHCGSTPHETFRAALTGRTPDGENSTLIDTRQGQGGDARVWLSFNGGIRTTVTMTDDETGELIELLDRATSR
jgi:hypothetical protein